MPDKIDPFDVAALERSLNDSATRVSTIWISFLIFSLYLLTAVATVTHRQLLLAEPLKLPVLNIELPLWGFFFLAPVIFWVFHVYVLLQVLLLGRTAAAYNDAIERAALSPAECAVLRQRLANTLFAQVLAGAPREREGWLGGLLKAMAWITLAAAPILILVVVELIFLPYQSHLVTWTHRLLILAELSLAFLLWPLALDAKRDLQWSGPRRRMHSYRLPPQITFSLASRVRRLFYPWKQLGDAGVKFIRSNIAPLSAYVFFVILAIFWASFPGEPHINLFTGHALASVNCQRWVHRRFDFADLRFDRLILPNVDIVDDEKLAKLNKATEEKGQSESEGERTQNLRGRSLRCGSFADADFRRVDFREADLFRADLSSADLRGATLDHTRLEATSLAHVKLDAASLVLANLQNADLSLANLVEAGLTSAKLQGANLSWATLVGATLFDTNLRAANLSNAKLQGAWLTDALMEGANLHKAKLIGANLHRTRLHGSNLAEAHLGAADLRGTQLQGADLRSANLVNAYVQDVIVWRTSGVSCSEAQVTAPRLDAVIDATAKREGGFSATTAATPEATSRFVEQVVNDLPANHKISIREHLTNRLGTQDLSLQQVEAIWQACAANAVSTEDFQKRVVKFILDLACAQPWNDDSIIDMLVEHMSFRELYQPPLFVTRDLAGELLSVDDTRCSSMVQLRAKTKALLQRSLNKGAAD